MAKSSSFDTGDKLGAKTSGETLGRFELRETLAQGQASTVYRAFDPQLDREVALKVARAESIASESGRRDFFWEARVVGGMRHPHFAPVYETGFAGSAAFISSGLIRGEGLDSYRRRLGGTLSPPRAAALGVKLARALEYAHSRGVIHRDVRSKNVIIDTAGEPTLLNFGAAIRHGERRSDDVPASRLSPYSSPEIVRGDVDLVDERTEQWSLGVMLYELLSGRRPFLAEGDALSLQIAQSLFPPLRSAAPHVPRDLAAIVERCLSAAPRNRYETCGALADDLQAFLDERPVAARPLPWFESLGRWARRRRALAASCGVVGLLAMSTIGGLLGSSWSIRNLNLRLERQRTATQALVDEADRQRNQAVDAARRTSEALAERRRLTSELDATLVKIQSEEEARQSAAAARIAAAEAKTKSDRELQELERRTTEAERQRDATAAALAEVAQNRPDDALRQSHLELRARYAVAVREIQAGETARALELLDEIPPAERHWEWWFLKEFVSQRGKQALFEAPKAMTWTYPERYHLDMTFNQDESRYAVAHDRYYLFDLTRQAAPLAAIPRKASGKLPASSLRGDEFQIVSEDAVESVEFSSGTSRRFTIPAAFRTKGTPAQLELGDHFFWHPYHYTGHLLQLVPRATVLQVRSFSSPHEFQDSFVHFRLDGKFAIVIDARGITWLVSDDTNQAPRRVRWKSTKLRGSGWSVEPHSQLSFAPRYERRIEHRPWLAFGPLAPRSATPWLALDGEYIALGSVEPSEPAEATGELEGSSEHSLDDNSAAHADWLAAGHFAQLLPGARRRLTSDGAVVDAITGVELLDLLDLLPQPAGHSKLKLSISPGGRWLVLLCQAPGKYSNGIQWAGSYHTYLYWLAPAVASEAIATAKQFALSIRAAEPADPQVALLMGLAREVPRPHLHNRDSAAGSSKSSNLAKPGLWEPFRDAVLKSADSGGAFVGRVISEHGKPIQLENGKLFGPLFVAPAPPPGEPLILRFRGKQPLQIDSGTPQRIRFAGVINFDDLPE